MKMKKSDLLKMVEENINNLQQTTMTIDTVNQGFEKIKSNVEQLKDMGVLGEEEDETNESEAIGDDLRTENIKEDFADSKIFSIIAEAEAPRISKKEILEFFKH
jgi:hypothetical protein